MTGGRFPVQIAATPEQVWPWVADLDRHAEWSPQPYTMTWTEGAPNAEGSKYHSTGEVPGDKHHQNDGTITEVRPPERFAFIAHDHDGDFTNIYTLTPKDGGTEVVHTLAFPERLNGAARFLAPVLFPLVGAPRFRARMQVLKAKVEGSAPASDG